MKVRQSFVANSSSSSFILGVSPALSVADYVIETLTDVIQHPYSKYSTIKQYTPEMIAYFLMGRLKSAYIDWESFDKLLAKGTVRDFFTIQYSETQQKFQMYGETSEIVDSIANDIQWQFYTESTEARYKLPKTQQPNNIDEYLEFDIKFFKSKKKYFIEALTTFKNTYQGKNVYMGEIEDSNSFEAGIEHNEVLWDILNPNMRFSHH